MRKLLLLSLPAFCRRTWLPGIALGLLSSCSSEGSQATTLPLPAGHYEGPISYQGTDLRVAVDLREVAPGKLEADVHFPELENMSFAAATISYQEPQLMFEQPGQVSKVSVTAIREGDFLRGVFTLDSIKAEFVWVRRGQAAPRPYQEKPFAVQANGRTERLTLLVPTDTATRHPAVALLADAASAAAATARADLLARQGFLAVVVPAAPVAEADSSGLQRIVAAFQALRKQAAVDSLQVGLWLRGESAAAFIPVTGLTQPAASFVVLENAPVASAAAARPFQELNRLRIPVLAYYAAADTSLRDAPGSARRLRTAVGARRGSVVRTFPLANTDFIVPGRLSADGKWTWPQPAPGFSQGLVAWLRQRNAR